MILKGSLAESATGPYTEGKGPAGRAASTASRRRPTRETRASPAPERTRRGSDVRSRASAERRRAVRGRWRTSRPPRHYFRRRGRAIPARRAAAREVRLAPRKRRAAAARTGPRLASSAQFPAAAAPAAERTRLRTLSRRRVHTLESQVEVHGRSAPQTGRAVVAPLGRLDDTSQTSQNRWKRLAHFASVVALKNPFFAARCTRVRVSRVKARSRV